MYSRTQYSVSPMVGSPEWGGWSTQFGKRLVFIRLAPTPVSPRGSATISEPQNCLFSMALQDESGQQMGRFDFDASELRDINVELVNQSDGVNRIRVTSEPALMQVFGMDGTAMPEPPPHSDFRTSLTLEEVEAASAALLKACSRSATPTEPG